MVQKLDSMFGFAQQALALRAQRQQVLASNIANADTPNYKAKDIDFASALRVAAGASGAPASPSVPAPVLARTDIAHLSGTAGASGAGAAGGQDGTKYRVPTQSSLDGNTVEMDYERAQFADNALHYEADLTVVNAQIHAMLAAIQS